MIFFVRFIDIAGIEKLGNHSPVPVVTMPLKIVIEFVALQGVRIFGMYGGRTDFDSFVWYKKEAHDDKKAEHQQSYAGSEQYLFPY
jgi:hypothetical protein